MRYPGFIGSSEVDVPAADVEDLTNWYYNTLSDSAKNRAALYPTPGFSTWTTVNDQVGRALFSENGHTWGVFGNKAYEFLENTTANILFSLVTDSNPAQIVTNGAVANQVLFASGTNAYYYNINTHANGLVVMGDATMIGMLDGFGIALNPDTSSIRISDLNDFTTWDPTQFAQRTAAPDNWAAMLVNAPDIWLIGQKTGDIWYDAGTFPFPFAPRVGLSYKYGIVAPFTLATNGASVFWLSRNEAGAGIVVRTRGYSPEPISTDSLEIAIAEYERTARITNAEGLIVQWEGHTIYLLHFPSVPQTWGYDIDENRWFKLGAWVPAQNRYDLFRARVHTYSFRKHITGDFNTGRLSIMDVAYGTEADGTVIRRERVAPGIFSEHRRVPIRCLEIYLESGAGTVSGQGVDPQVILQTSDDGGHTWAPQRTASAGQMGQYQRRVRFWGMGLPRDRVYRLVVSDPIAWSIVDAYLNNDGPPGGSGG